MGKLFFGWLLFFGMAAQAQTYNNEWIDYSKTYYKFIVGSNGLYRINAAVLSAAGLGGADAQHLQLFRNGVEVPLYTSVASGAFSSTDYIEFWGVMNDGKPDKELYRDPSYQLNDKWSLLTDSATYFLTVNPTGPNLRLLTTTNNVSGNALPAEPYFTYTTGQYFRAKINPGFYNIVGADGHLLSSSYDKGEGWTSNDIGRAGVLAVSFPDLYAAPGHNASLRIAVTGNAYNNRRYKVTVNGDPVLDGLLSSMDQDTASGSFDGALLNTGVAGITVSNLTDGCVSSPCPADAMVVHKVELTYGRQFNFGGAADFEFSLPAGVAGAYLEITNFAHGGIAPVLYDLTNGKRYVTEISGSLVKVALQPSPVERNLVLVSEAAGAVNEIGSLQVRNFINYNTAAAQGNYLIITNSILFNGSNGNPVEDYRTYRASAAGGGYNAKIYLEDQLIDQFGFGIKKNPAGIRNFILYARSKYPFPLRHVFIIGRGVHYLHQRSYESSSDVAVKANLDKLNLVPTFGYPASDMMLAADVINSTPLVSIGRLTAITPDEVALYLKKVKEAEGALQTLSPSPNDKAWMKNVAHIIGAGDDALDNTLFQYMESYRRKAEDSLWGANVYTFRKTSDPSQLTEADLTNLIDSGVSLITYYGHSSAVSLEFNLGEPSNYNNQGKYPMFLALGCNAGNTFDYQESRFSQRNYLSDKYVLEPDKGSINFIASSHFGIVNYLDLWNSLAYTNFSTTLYGRPIGEIIKKTTTDVYNFATSNDFFARCNAEETILNGDPAVALNQQAKPDYAIIDTMVKIAPSVSVADRSFKVDLRFLNLGKAINKQIVVETKRQYPDQTMQVIRRDTVANVKYDRSLSFTLPIDPIRDTGTNRIYVTVDANNDVDELFETNNVAYREFVITGDEARPLYPANMAIVNQSNIALLVSTADPFSTPKPYRVEIDTTENFNSPTKVVLNKTAGGGLISFDPGFTLKDSTVYYWRVAPQPALGNGYTWNTASFVYLSNSEPGFNQSHYYQHRKSAIDRMTLNEGSAWEYKMVKNNLLIRSGVFVTAVTQAAEFAVEVNGVSYIRSVCAWPSLIVNVFDQNTFQPWYNGDVGAPGQYGSDAICGTERRWNFQYVLNDSSKRRKLVEFLESIPSGNIVAIRNFGTSDPAANVFAGVWQGDTAALGHNRSIYHLLKAQGFSDVDSFYRPRALIFTYKKDRQSEVAPKSLFSDGIYDKIALSADYYVPDTLGFVTSPVFGPAKTWKEFKWRGESVDPGPSDDPSVSILGIKANGMLDTLLQNITPAQAAVNISTIDAAAYPALKMFLRNKDNNYHTPYQLKNWRLTYVPLPEGALAPGILFQMKDTLATGEAGHFKIAFKNISTSNFTDSLDVKVMVTDHNGVQHGIPVPRLKPLQAADTVTVQFTIDTRQLPGVNTLLVDVNPDNNQPEQYRFNNIAYRQFYVVACPLSTTSFYAGTANGAFTYQWQVNKNDGNGFADIVDNGYYAGTATPTLAVTGAPTQNNGYRYRCKIMTGQGTAYSAESGLKIMAVWTGAGDNAWENSGNWACGIVPDENTDVIINADAPRFPVVNADASCKSVNIGSGATLTVRSGYHLTLTGKPQQ